MSDLLTRLAQRAVGAAPPPVQPRLPARYADGGPADDAPSAFAEAALEVDPPAPAFPPRPAPAAPRSAPGEAATAPRAPSAVADEPAPPSAPAAPPPAAGAPALPPAHEEREAARPTAAPAPPPAAAPPPADGGRQREIHILLEGDDGGLLMPPPAARRVESLVSAEPSAAPRGKARTEDAPPPGERVAEAPEVPRDAGPRDRIGPTEVVQVVEVVEVVEAAAGRRPAESGTDGGPVPAEERTPGPAAAARPSPVQRVERAAPAVHEAAEREPSEERPVVRVTIGRIEVRAAQPPPAPQPLARPGYTPPVMSLDEYLKREAAR